MPLLFEEPTSGTLKELLREDNEMAAWWGTWVESAVAVSRLKREGGWTTAKIRHAHVGVGRPDLMFCPVFLRPH